MNSRFKTVRKRLKTSHLQGPSFVPKLEQADENHAMDILQVIRMWLKAREDRTLDIDRVLSELKRERKQLDHAIAALESIRRQGAKKSRAVRQARTRIKSTAPRRTCAVDSPFGKAAKVIRFPRLRRSGS